MMTTYRKVAIAGVNVFYREAGPKDAPAIVLLHGFPSSSHMFRDLIHDLSDRFHLIAPDYPGFGNSDCPDPREYAYTFDHLSQTVEKFLETLGVTRFSLYMQDYGGPIGFRLASRHPEWIESLIVQNANAYTEGLSEAWAPLRALWQDRQANETAVRSFLLRETTVFQYTHGANNAGLISPDGYNSDQAFLDRPGNDVIQMELFFDYQANLRLYPEWQAYLKKRQPRTLIVWGKNDPFFTVAGAEAFKKDLDSPEIHLIDAGHFALEEAHEKMAALIGAFISQPHTSNGGLVWGIARVVAAPGRETELRSALDTVVAATRQEPGNLSFDLYQAAGDPTFFIHESWRSQEDLHRHFSTPYVSHFKVSLATLALRPLELTQLESLANHQPGRKENHEQTSR
jgi:pimeloyl-ACP methyl ester carboxylesterase/quinol monooxygenase YgiN